MATLPKQVKSIELNVDNFGHLHVDNEYLPVKRFTWKNQNRLQVQLINYGGTITSIKCPNRKGIIDDIVLGFDDMKGYMEHLEYYYGLIGRSANVIKKAYYIQNKKEIKLTNNMCGHHCNGGETGFDKVLWDYYIAGNKVVLSHFSADGTEGYPGDLIVFAVYELTSNNEFRIDIKAYSTKITICNLTNSMYVNLAGHNTGVDEVNKHEITLNADCKIVTNNECIPTGEIKAVFNTIYDFQIPVKVGAVLEKLDGFNTHFCINRGAEQGNCFAVRLIHPESGRIMEIYTNQHGIQLETANNFPLRPEIVEKAKKTISPYLKTSVATFDIIDEIHNRVYEIMTIDKENSYNDFLKFLKDLQKKEGNSLHRSNSNSSVIPYGKYGSIKRSKITLDNLSTATLNHMQVRYLEKIIQKITNMPESEPLSRIQEILEKAYQKNKPDNISVHSHRSEETYGYKDVRGKKGARYNRHCGICLQPQNYPDAPNNPNFPTASLKPGNVYHNTITYKFYIKNNMVGVSGFM